GIKRRRESMDMYASAGRDELAARERDEIATLETFLPPPVDEGELRAAVRAAIDGGATTIGAVMGRVLPQFRGRADGSAINAVAREELARQG
ncbi:MAG TPA: GatB/YqeY domain-containing protein, partial [Gemmatimonadaceae bacterium]